MSIEEDEEIRAIFVEESRDHLEELEHGIILIEADCGKPDEDLVNRLFRSAHSVKAGANLLDFKNIETLAHALENILDMVRHNKMQINGKTTNLLLQCLDKIGDMINHLEFSDLINISYFVEKLASVVQDKSR